MQEIASGVYVKTDYEGANVGCILTEVGAIVIDTPLIPADGKAWAAQVAEVTEEVLYVFNTDHHRAHILGNQYFDAPIIAHEVAWREISNYKDTFIDRTKNIFKKQPEIAAQFDEVQLKKPEITFTGRLILKKGEQDALKRADAYVEAGADAIMIHSKERTAEEVLSFCKTFRKNHPAIPLVVVPTTYSSTTEQELHDAGANLIIYANQLLRSAYPAMTQTAKTTSPARSGPDIGPCDVSSRRIRSRPPGMRSNRIG